MVKMFSIPNRHRPFAADVLEREVNQFHQRVVLGKVPRYLPIFARLTFTNPPCSGACVTGILDITMLPPFCQGSRRYTVAGVLLAAALTVWAGPLGFSTSVSEALINEYVSRFGQESRERLLRWQGFMKGRATDARAEREILFLVTINAHFNRVRFMTDIEHWGVSDYWATPAEFIASNGGDCEDYSIAKYFALKELGVPIERLRITYVTSSLVKDAAHMVLAYYPTPQADPLILDNLDFMVRRASQRPDLVAVYSFNEEDAQSAGGSRAHRQVRRWRELTDRLEREART